MAGDVLRGDAAGTLGESLVIAYLFVGGELLLRMGVEIGTIVSQSEHQKQFGVHARGGDLVHCEAGDGRH